MKTRHIFQVIIFTLLIAISITGCVKAVPDPTNGNSTVTQIFSGEIVESSYQEFVMCDTETSVMYMQLFDCIGDNYTITNGSILNGGDSAIAPIYNVDGSLRTYDDSTKIEPLVKISCQKITKTNYEQITMYDPATLAMYVFLSDPINHHFEFIPMYNSDGTLRKYSSSIEIDSLVWVSSEVISNSRYYQTILYDPSTLVMYMCIQDYYRESFSGEFTIIPMYNQDGSFKTYNSKSKIDSLVAISSGEILDTRYQQFFAYDPDTLVIYMFTLDYINGDTNVNVMYNLNGYLRTYYDGLTEVAPLVKISSEDISGSRYKEILVYDSRTLVMYMCTWDKFTGGSTITVQYDANNSVKSYK